MPMESDEIQAKVIVAIIKIHISVQSQRSILLPQCLISNVNNKNQWWVQLSSSCVFCAPKPHPI